MCTRWKRNKNFISMPAINKSSFTAREESDNIGLATK